VQQKVLDPGGGVPARVHGRPACAQRRSVPFLARHPDAS
jgi:hypothetical protein